MLGPVTIATFSGVSDVPGFCGPYQDGSDLYTVLIDRGANEAAVYQSTDGGATWASVGAIAIYIGDGQPMSNVRVAHDVEGRVLWLAVLSTGGALALVPFDLASLTFGAASTLTGAPVPQSFAGGAIAPRWEIQRRSDGSFIVYVSYDSLGESIAEYHYDLAGLGGWDSTFFTPSIPSGQDQLAIQSSLISASGSDNIHGFTWDNSLAGTYIRDYGVQPYFNTSGTLLATSFGGRAGNQPMVGHALSWDDSGTWRLTVPYWQLDDLHVIECTDADPPAGMTDTMIGTLSGGFGAPLTSVVMLSGVRYLFSATENIDGTRNIVYWSNDGSGWTGPVVILANVYAFNVSAAPVLGGIGVVYDDSTTGGGTDVTRFLLWSPGAVGACRYRWIS